MQLKTGISGTQKPGLPSSMEKKSTTTARDRQCYNQIMPPSWCMPHNLQNTGREGLVLLINFLNKNIEAWSKKVCRKQASELSFHHRGMSVVKSRGCEGRLSGAQRDGTASWGENAQQRGPVGVYGV